MKKTLSTLTALAALALSTEPMLAEQPTDAEWHHPLYLGHNNIWKQRIPVVIENKTANKLEGDPLTLMVGKGKGEIPLAGMSAESIRVITQEGTELLFRLNGPDGAIQEKGEILSNTKLTIPAECAANASTTYFVYFDNESAWPVGEYFFTHREITNGDFESTGQFGPLDWELPWPEAERTVDWDETQVHSGTKSLKVYSEEIDEKQRRRPYGAHHTNVHLIPGEKYVIEAWIKGENISGKAGLNLRPQNLGRTKRGLKTDNFQLETAEGSFDWKKIAVEFTAPEEANILTINTFMEGTGTFWVDDINVTCDFNYDIEKHVGSVESSKLSEKGKTEKWYSDSKKSPDNWPLRASITIPNFGDETLKDHPVYVDVQMLKNRLYSDIDENSHIQITNGTKPIPSIQMGHGILFKETIPAHTFQTFYIYFSDSDKVEDIKKPNTYSNLGEITENLVANSNFEEATLSGWETFGDTAIKTITVNTDDGIVQIAYSDAEDKEGDEVLDIEVRHSAVDNSVGISQILDIEAGSSYLFSARVKSSDVLQRPNTLQARFLDGSHEFTGDKVAAQANPDMHQNNEWVQETMIITAPEEAIQVRIDLLNTKNGEISYDDVFFIKIGNGSTGALALEQKAAQTLEGLVAWQENAMVKVFPDDLPEEELEFLNLTAAKHDSEPIQLVLRSSSTLDNLEIVVSEPVDSKGNTLQDIEIGIVDYVPINYPSNYYRDFETRFWQTKIAKGKIGSDGWTGWWPDPILPFSKLDLPANKTMAAWIEITVPDNATPGHYKGKVSLRHNGKSIKEIPLKAQVYDFTLPEANNVEAAYDLRFNEREMFGHATTEKEKNVEILEYMRDHRVSTDTIRPEPVFTLVDGEVKVDFTEFDKGAAQYFDELKFQGAYTPWIFYLFGWGHAPKSFMGEAPYEGEYPYHGVDRSKLRPEYVKLYQSALRQYWTHMKENGWDKKVAMYISDEPHAEPEIEEQMKALCDMIHEVDADIPIYVSTWWYRPEFEGYVNVWGVSHRGGGWGHPVPAEHLEEITKNGGEIYFTTDGMQCTDTPYLAFERLLPHFCFKFGAKKYEFWGANWHTLDPYNYGWHRFHRQSPSVDVWYWMRYPNGDGNFIYPGQPIGVDHLVASTRLKLTREGVEDYEFFHILRELIKENNAAGKDTTKGQAALDRALTLVNIPSADGRYTTGYVSDPDAILDIRHQVATAIEELSHQ